MKILVFTLIGLFILLVIMLIWRLMILPLLGRLFSNVGALQLKLLGKTILLWPSRSSWPWPYSFLLRIFNSAYYHYTKGLDLLMAGKADDAVTELQKALELRRGNYPAASFSLGEILYRRKNYEAAIEAYRKALTSADDKWQGRLNYYLGHLLLEKGNISEAVSAFLEAKSHSEGKAPQLDFNLGRAYTKISEFSKAVEAFHQGYSFNENHFPDFRYDYGVALEKLEELDEALIQYEKYIQEYPIGKNINDAKLRVEEIKKRNS